MNTDPATNARARQRDRMRAYRDRTGATRSTRIPLTTLGRLVRELAHHDALHGTDAIRVVTRVLGTDLVDRARRAARRATADTGPNRGGAR